MNWYKEAKKDPMEEFSYGDDVKQLWSNMLFMEQDRVDIHFNNENDDGFDIKTKELKFKHNDDEYRVTARICWAGGDWENPICYFHCQFENRMKHDGTWGKWNKSCVAIIIPEKSNLNLTKGKNGGLVASQDYSKNKRKEIKDNDLWNEMVAMADKRIKGYMEERMDYDGKTEFEYTGCARRLVDLMASKRKK